MICRKTTFTISVSAVKLPDANFLSSRAQNRGFCALLGSGTLVFGLFEHKNGIFVRFCPPGPPFSGISSTKSGFLCAFGVWNPRYRAFRAQNRHFCALFDFGTPIFRLFEHNSGVFLRFWPSELGCNNGTLSFYGSRSGFEAATLDADETYLP